MDELDRRLLDLMQAGVPYVERPYRALGERVGLAEAEVLARLERLRAERVVRQVCAIFDTPRLGYRSSLVAATYPPERLEAAAAVVSAHPGVTHNYQRNHDFNLWYTIAVPPASDLEAHVARLHELSGALSTRLLPTLRRFKIGVRFDLSGEPGAEAAGPRAEAAGPPAERPRAAHGRRRAADEALSADDVALVRLLQQDLPAVEQPFAPLAEQLGWSQARLLAAAEDLERRGLCRRFAALLRHREAGFGANAMGVWIAPPEQVEALGQQMAAFPAVSHCYQRPTYPDWPYNLFTMVHGRTADECEQALAAIAAATGLTRSRALYSSREFKKTRLVFFDGQIEAWEARYLPATATAS